MAEKAYTSPLYPCEWQHLIPRRCALPYLSGPADMGVMRPDCIRPNWTVNLSESAAGKFSSILTADFFALVAASS
jgi:hypothetical protein